MLSSTGWVQSIVIFLVSFFFFNATPLPLNVVLGFFCTAFAFFVNVSLTGAPGAFFKGGATVFLTVTAAVKVFLGGAAGAAGFLSATGFFSTVFLATTGAFFTASDSFLTALTDSGFLSVLAGSFFSFLVALGASSAGRLVALPFGSSLSFLGSSFFPFDWGTDCCCPFLDCFTSGSFVFSGSAFLPLGSALPDLGFSLVGSGLALDLAGCCAAGLVGFLPVSFLLSATFFCADAYK